MITPELISLLREVDTPTVCNTLIFLDPALRGRGYTFERVIAAHPALPAIVGFARTAHIVSSQPSIDSAQTIRERRFDYYQYVSSGLQPKIVVMEDNGPLPGYGCIWGEINVAIHSGFGIAGAITNGAIRDLGSVNPDFQLLGGNVCPGSGFAHITDFGQTVKVFGLEVSPDDLIHADQHGAVIIPPSFFSVLYTALKFVLRREAVLLEAAKKPGFDYQALRVAWAAFEALKQ
jgi:regulator of RNase E activity RraA